MRILHFGDELRRGINHSQENFEQVMYDIDLYDTYCKEHPEFKNHKTHMTTQEILNRYKQCMDDNSFL